MLEERKGKVLICNFLYVGLGSHKNRQDFFVLRKLILNKHFYNITGIININNTYYKRVCANIQKNMTHSSYFVFSCVVGANTHVMTN